LIERDIEILNRLGLHARAAAKLVKAAGGFRARVQVLKDGETVDAKSILGLMVLAASQGTHLTLRCEGEDEEAAMAAVSALFADRFQEE
jgi:phosphocarrier protein